MFVGWVLPEVDLKTKIQVVYLEGKLPKHGPSSGEVRQAKEGSDSGWITRYPLTVWATKSPSHWDLWAWSTPQNYLDWGKRAWYLPPVPVSLCLKTALPRAVLSAAPLPALLCGQGAFRLVSPDFEKVLRQSCLWKLSVGMHGYTGPPAAVTTLKALILSET